MIGTKGISGKMLMVVQCDISSLYWLEEDEASAESDEALRVLQNSDGTPRNLIGEWRADFATELFLL